MESNIYNYEMIRSIMKPPKRDILPNDVLIYKNGEKAVLYEQYFWTLLKFYDDDLNHIYNDDYTIIEVLRPHYERIYDRDKDLQKRK